MKDQAAGQEPASQDGIGDHYREFVARVWLRAADREVRRCHMRRAEMDDVLGSREFMIPAQKHLLREHWTDQQRTMLVRIAGEWPFQALCPEIKSLASATSAIGYLAYRKLLEPGPSPASEPRLTTRGIITAQRFADAAVFDGGPA